MSQNQRFQAPPRKKNALDEYKLRLSARPQQGAQKPSSLAFSVVKNMVHVDVYTNVPNDKDNGRIRAAMDSPTFFAMLELLNLAIESNEPFSRKIENKNFTFYQGKRSEAPQIVSNTMVGKDKEGRVFLAVLAKDRPNIPFYFLPSSFHSLTMQDGSPVDEGTVSVIYAKGFLKLLYTLVPTVLSAEYVEPAPRDPQQGGQQQRPQNNYQGNNQQRQEAPAATTGAAGAWGEDDFPM